MKCLNKHKTCFIILGILLSLIIIFGIYFSPTAIGFDENYTLALINHSYHNIIYLDSMDVHPILYYFLLKTFIKCTTFWTSSFLAKIISARIFSLIISIVLFIFLVAILKLLNIKNNIFLEWLLFLILPGVLNSSGVTNSQLVTIRMYGLASLFIVAEVFNLLKYDIYHNHKYIYISTILAICAAYTHYYAAIFGGLLLLIYFVKNLLHHNNDYKSFFLAGIILLIFYIPWIPIFLKQLSNPFTYWMTNSKEINQDIRFILILIIFVYPIYKWNKTYKNKLFNIILFNLLFTLIPTFVLVFIYSFINHPMFEIRYMLPILIIYEFISINIIVKFLVNHKMRLLGILILLLCLVGFARTLKTQIYGQYDSVYVYKKYNSNKSQKINKYSINHRCAGDVLSNMLYNNKHIIISKGQKSAFKKQVNIFYRHNPTYSCLFRSEINRMEFK